MPERHYKLKCLGRDVTMIVDDEKGVAFDGYDERAERSLKAFGKKGSSLCWIVAYAVVEGTLVEDLFRYIETKEDAETVYALAAAAGVNITNKYGETPLHWAAYDGRTDAVEALLRHEDIDVNAVDKDGYTPLYWAARWGHTNAVEALLRHEDIDVNAVDKDGDTPLHEAAYWGYTKIVQLIEDWLEKHPDG